MEINLKVTDKEVQLIATGLAQLPYGMVFNLINKLQTQAKEQTQTKEMIQD